jgi:hypothetical protein
VETKQLGKYISRKEHFHNNNRRRHLGLKIMRNIQNLDEENWKMKNNV